MSASGRRQSVRTGVVWTAVQALLGDADAAPARIVDVGGGTGGFAVPLAQLGHRVEVIDPSPDALAATGGFKGLYQASPVVGRPFLDLFAAEILQTGVSCGKLPLWLLMTSHVTDAQVNEWLDNADLWGMPRSAVIPFRQGRVPRLGPDGALDVILRPC